MTAIVSQEQKAPVPIEPDEQRSAPLPPRRSLRRNFAWALTGNLIYQGSQWLNLVILAKLLTAADVGQFALALAICSPITTFSTLQLRSIQVTDTRGQHRFGHFLAVQLLSSTLALLVIATIAVTFGYEPQFTWLMIAVGLGQIVIATREVFIAFNQKHERMDAVAISKTMLGASSLTALGTVVWATGNLLAGVIAMQVAKLAVFLLWDLRATGRLVRAYTGESAREYLHPIWDFSTMFALVLLALPLAITGVLASIYTNVPRYLIAGYLDEEHLGYFAAIMALVGAGTLVTQAAAMSALPRLSRYYLSNRKAYLSLLLKLALFGGWLGVAALIVVALSGELLLTVVFKSQYAAYRDLFVWSMAFGAMAYVVTFLGCGMTAMRRFRIQPIANFGALIVATFTGWLFIPEYGLVAGVWCLMAGKLTQGCITAIVIWTGLRCPVARVDVEPNSYGSE